MQFRCGSIWHGNPKNNLCLVLMGLTENVRRKNRLLVAATLEELSSEGKQSAILETLCDKLLGFAKKP